jgi:hypothetical protein
VTLVVEHLPCKLASGPVTPDNIIIKNHMWKTLNSHVFQPELDCGLCSANICVFLVSFVSLSLPNISLFSSKHLLMPNSSHLTASVISYLLVMKMT